jgi:VanZ family protein
MRSVFLYKSVERRTARVPRWQWWLSVWTPVVIALCVIAAESTNTMSAKNTSSWLRPIVQRIFGVMQDASWETFHHVMRKTGHFVGYGLVCLTFLRAWLHTLYKRGRPTLLAWRLEACMLAILSTAIVASLDEFHQTFLPDRTGTPLDVLLDSTGALVVCVLVWLVCWMRAAVPEEA